MGKTNKGYLLLAAIALVASPAVAQDVPPAATSGTVAKGDAGQAAAEPAKAEAPPADFSLNLTAGGVSGYRFRGISLSDKKAAFQPSFTVTHKSGFHFGAWGSNITPNSGDNIELDLVGGWVGKVGPLTVDISATDYVYPGSGIGTTLAANAMSMAALRANLEQVMTPANYAVMEARAERLAAGLAGAIAGLPWQVARVGARIEFIFAAKPLRNGTEARAAHLVELEQAVHICLLNQGVLIAPFHNMMLVSPATSDDDIERLVAATRAVVAGIADD